MIQVWTLPRITLTCISCFALLGLPTTSQSGEKPVVQGKWKIVKTEYDGADSKPNDSGVLVVAESTITYRFDGGWIFGSNASVEYRYKIDTSKIPNTIDLISKGEDGKENVLRGIFEVHGREVKVCLGKERPRDYTTRKDSERVLLILRRR